MSDETAKPKTSKAAENASDKNAPVKSPAKRKVGKKSAKRKIAKKSEELAGSLPVKTTTAKKKTATRKSVKKQVGKQESLQKTEKTTLPAPTTKKEARPDRQAKARKRETSPKEQVRKETSSASDQIDAEELKKRAWKIFLAEVSEEGLALINDQTAKEISRRSFRLAQIFLEESLHH